MPAQPLPIVRRLSATARVLACATALASAILVVYWSTRIALGAPDAYRGQHGGGLLLSLALLTNSSSGLVGPRSLRIAFPIVSIVCLVLAAYFFLGAGTDVGLR